MFEENTQSSDEILGLRSILDLCEERTFCPGEMIFAEGAENPNFYIIMDGQVEIAKKTSGGESKVIAQIGRGDFLGEGILSGRVIKPASARAVTEVKTAALTLEKFSRLIKEKNVAVIDFLLYTSEIANNRLISANAKLLALCEVNRVMHTSGSSLKELAKNLINMLIVITKSKNGILCLKNPFDNSYRVIYSTADDLTERAFTEYDVNKSEIAGKFLIVRLENMGFMAFVNDAGHNMNRLRFLELIAEQAAFAIKEAVDRDNDKAKELMKRKQFAL